MATDIVEEPQLPPEAALMMIGPVFEPPSSAPPVTSESVAMNTPTVPTTPPGLTEPTPPQGRVEPTTPPASPASITGISGTQIRTYHTVSMQLRRAQELFLRELAAQRDAFLREALGLVEGQDVEFDEEE